MYSCSGRGRIPLKGFACWIVFLILQGLGSVTAKIVSGQVALSSGKPWAYLSKFSYSLGTGNFTLEVTEASVRIVFSPLLFEGGKRGREKMESRGYLSDRVQLYTLIDNCS